MGNVITIVCCSENHGENNLDGEIEDKITVEEKMNNYDDPQIQMPVLHRSFSERTLLVN